MTVMLLHKLWLPKPFAVDLLIYFPTFECITLLPGLELERRLPSRLFARSSHRHPTITHQNVRKQSSHLCLPLGRGEMRVGRVIEEVKDLRIE